MYLQFSGRITDLDIDGEDERVAIEMSGTSPPTPDPDFVKPSTNTKKMRLKARDETLRRRERETCRGISGLGRETATYRPAAHFRINLVGMPSLTLRSRGRIRRDLV